MKKSKRYYSLTIGATEADLMIFGDITPYQFFESDVSSHGICSEIAALDVDRINVHINSYGGDVGESLAIVNSLNRSRAKVVTYNDGFACSAAATVFMAGDERIASKYSAFLIHNAWSTVTGNSEDFLREAENLETITNQSKELYAEKSKLSKSAVTDLMREERFLSPEEMLEMGFATEIDDTEEDEDAAQAVKFAVFQRFLGKKQEDTDEEENGENEDSADEGEEPEDDEEIKESDADETEEEEPEEDEEEEGEEPEQHAEANAFAKFLKRRA